MISCTLLYCVSGYSFLFFFFFFNATATTEIYTLSLHDALPISYPDRRYPGTRRSRRLLPGALGTGGSVRSEEHTSELQSHSDLVCRLLLEKKKKKKQKPNTTDKHEPTTNSSITNDELTQTNDET